MIHKSHNFINGCLGTGIVTSLDLGRHAALSKKELQPAGPTFLCSSFRATQKISFRQGTDELARAVGLCRSESPGLTAGGPCHELADAVGRKQGLERVLDLVAGP